MTEEILQPEQAHGKGLLRNRIYTVIFEADTLAGKLFDLGLIISIALSVSAVMLKTVQSLPIALAETLTGIEWFFTILFTIEYCFRIYCVKKPLSYATSFYGAVDLLSFLPTYISIALPGGQYFMVIRTLRVLRIFRVLKLAQYLTEARILVTAVQQSKRKIIVFLLFVLTLVTILGSAMFVIEGDENGFTDIPTSIYWAIVTMTTVGYGDISPQTPLGKALAAAVMIIGYAIIAIPTGIVTAQFLTKNKDKITTQTCQHCLKEGHDSDASFCKFCGEKL